MRRRLSGRWADSAATLIGSQCDIPLTLKIGKKVIHRAKDPVCGGELASLHNSKPIEARYMLLSLDSLVRSYSLLRMRLQSSQLKVRSIF